jgi:hypothetical protein
VRLRAAEGKALVETDASEARAGYLAALEAIAEQWNSRLLTRGGRLVRAQTSDDPVDTVRSVVLAAEGVTA